ncbi:host specificity protein J [Hafnia alvei]|uniref:host specificity protein J n=1 Tax=Hafnia alvei TaxID=569 RepID=UPI001034C813|nr:host specificity protein J [Hafnia alvei]TBL40760.1 host specificity protein J [Hafnia alvei]
MQMIHGKKGGGGSGHKPRETPDNAQSTAYAKILLALAEGELGPTLDGRNIFLDGTPVLNQDGSTNFEGLKYEYRSGTQAQDYIQGMPDTQNEITINTPLKNSQPWTRAINNTQLSAVRVRLGFPMLQEQKDNGDTVGYRITYEIDLATNGGPFEKVLSAAVDAKFTTLYERSHRIDLPKSPTGWQIRIRRTSADTTSNRINSLSNVEAIAEIIDAKLRYPNTALLYVEFDASQFQNIPKISCRPDGRYIRVPDNYDPQTRTYSGNWEGAFKFAISNNPAWVLFDLIIEKRFGLGQRLNITQVDKWELYRIAQYCDQMISNGRGGLEPRFLCDVYIQSQQEAFTVLRDFASIFRGMMSWTNNKLVILSDMPRDVDYSFSRASLVGDPIYSGGSQKNRYSTAMVSWSNPLNGYQDEVEPVFDADLVFRYGINETQITAIGCTRQTESQRRGNYILLTNSKDEAVSFTPGLDGALPPPGSIVSLPDERRAGRPIGGRISKVNGRNVTLDRIPGGKAGDRLQVNLPSGVMQSRTIEAINDRTVTVSLAYSELPEAEAVWGIDADDLAIKLWRVIGVSENQNNTYAVQGIEYDPNKFLRIDTGVKIDSPPTSVIPPGVQALPTNITITSFSVINQGLAVTTMHAAWDVTQNAIAYEAQWKKDNGNWITAPRSSTAGFDISGIYAGRYLVRVRAINASEVSSVWATSMETELKGKEGKPPQPIGFKAEGVFMAIDLSWSFPADAGDTLKTEIQRNTINSEEGAILLSDIPYPQRIYQHGPMAAGAEVFYRARLVDRSGNQGEWTDWIQGLSSTDLNLIGDIIQKGIEESDTFKEIDKNLVDSNAQLQSAADAAIQNALANDADVRRWMVQNGDRKAEIIETQQLVADETEARATAVTQLKTQTDKTSSDLTEFRETVAKDNEATAQKITQLNSKTDTTNSNITELSKTVAEGDKALSEKVSALTTTVNGNTAAIQTKATTNFNQAGVGSAVYSINAGVTYNGVYHSAGFAIGADVTAAGAVTTRILFKADQLAFMTSADGKSYGMPFFISGGQVFIQNTVIQNGSIDSLKIANTLQSNNFVSGKSGWRLDKNTGLEFATVLPGGGRAVYDGYGMSMYDNNNVKRFGAGYKP